MSLILSVNFKIIIKPRNEQTRTEKILRFFLHRNTMITIVIIITDTGVFMVKNSMAVNIVCILSKQPPYM